LIISDADDAAATMPPLRQLLIAERLPPLAIFAGFHFR